MKLNFTTLFLSLTALFPLLISCSPKDTTFQKPKLEEVTISISSPTSQESWQAKWDSWLKEARKEGKVVIYGTFGGGVREPLIHSFKDKYGIDADIVIGKGAETSEKIFSERRAGIYLADVYVGGPTTLVTVIMGAGIIAPLEPLLLLPEVLAPGAWWKGELDWLDDKYRTLAFLAYPSAPLLLYTPVVKPEDIESYLDLLDPKWKGKIVMNDPTLAGTGPNWVGIVGDKIMGMSYMRDFARQNPVIVRDQRLQVHWVAQGKYPIGVQAKTDVVQVYLDSGAPIVEHTPREGAHLTSGSGNLGVFDKNPHPNASRIFVNWLLSSEGQMVFSRAYGAQSGRTDVPTDHLPSSGIRIPGMKYHSSYDYDYISKKAKYFVIAREIYGHLMEGR